MRNPIHELLKNMKMRTKIFVATILVVSVFMGPSFYQSLVIHKKTAMDQASEFSDHILDNVYSAIRFPMSMGDEKTIKEQMKDVKEHMDGVQVYIADFYQNISYTSEKERIDSNMEKYLQGNESRKALAEALATGKAPGISFPETEGEDPFLVTIKPILNESSCYHCHGSSRKVLGAMIIKQPVKDLFAVISYTKNRLIIYFAAALIGLVVFINLFFSRLVSRRIQLLEEKTSRVAAGDVTVEAVDDSRDSIGSLSRNFNQMVKSIRDRMEYANSLKLGIVDPFFMVDPEMKVTFINENAARMSRLSLDEAIGRPCHEVFYSSACEKDCPVKKALDTGEIAEGKRMTLTDRKGNEITAMYISSILKDSSGKVLGAFEIIRDLTAEVEAEKSLQEAYLREGKAKQELEKKVDDLSKMLSLVAKGDFTMRGTLSGTEDAEDAMDVMTKRINGTLDSVVNLIAQVKDHIVPVIRGVAQISEGNQSLSQRTQQQASAMEEISATLEQLVSNITENLTNTRNADSLSKDAVKVAQEGVEEVEKTSYAMVEMSSASQKIVEMVELINEITFQTNLLSINAAVEAARAGEQGRGFAVVASEIRNLAKGSGAASKDIQTLVKEIISKVTATEQWVNKLKECFTKIVQTSRQVSDALGEVSLGNEESSKGIEQISDGTQEMSNVNEKNAYFVEELSQETHKLTEKAQELHNIVGVFILGDNDPLPVHKNRRKSEALSTPLHEDMAAKPPVDDLNEDLLEKEFEGGFEEF
ncbi:MAG: PAS domain-containing protein [Desulfobacteraceae bacterium]|uniref:PAS domain-containing protein n=1 Tax=Candidatus Desulfaltia bathyphila TaxID=2841697 RepID=A0A8J6T7K7_9BACT|nr:PAS domain-containing protein [Candidatus Desulfaltia bathyphila]MBL7195112.1 PAS domain-containing protein [Desulfobacterales bacterium]